ncbi:ABC transporter substrate-binding protein [Hippea maritima]|uniref:Extracellular ligand-binding receptor n=1 Tax=Hippea maritima (strain ATCC 700847 / DSM 10411 / MH2) TaxID=760142 RepID=F2LVK6_HIPMA|nr:ABC transporter substrate-binding protein [Hippea maritima]AEA33790.1 Extracellular ligand-binding receptor [Hippea maritima DSM 10411]
MVRVILSLVFVFIFSFSATADNLKVGVYLSTTGPVAAWGRLEWDGIKVAHSLKGKVRGKSVKLILEDVGSRPEGAALAAEKLVNEGIRFVVGPVASFAAFAAIPIFEKYGVVDVIPTANAKGLSENRTFISRVCFNNAQQARVMANYIASAKLKKGVIVEDISQDYSVDLTNNFIKEFKKCGGTVIKIFRISSSDSDFLALATQIKRLNPDFVYLTTYYNSIALTLKDLRAMGYKNKVFAGSAASSQALIDIAKDAAEGLVFTDDFDPLIPQGRLSKNFIDIFKKRYDRFPDSPEALAADAYLLLINSIEKSRKLTPIDVANEARNAVFYGVTGKIIIKNGIVKRTIVLRKVENSQFRPVAVFEP